MNGYLGDINDISIRVTKKYRKENGSYGYTIKLMTDSDSGIPEEEKFAFCRMPEKKWYAKYGYTDAELKMAIQFVMNKTNNGEDIEVEPDYI